VHDLDGDVAGVTSSDYNPSTGHYDTGRVVLDADAYRELADQPGGHLEERAILLHELGHLVGLAHVDDPGELMYPTVGTRSTYGPGDLEGLRLIGQVPC
jgi:predicted Zn-dependent protease